jgi:hypothetical protein
LHLWGTQITPGRDRADGRFSQVRLPQWQRFRTSSAVCNRPPGEVIPGELSFVLRCLRTRSTSAAATENARSRESSHRRRHPNVIAGDAKQPPPGDFVRCRRWPGDIQAGLRIRAGTRSACAAIIGNVIPMNAKRQPATSWPSRRRKAHELLSDGMQPRPAAISPA